MPDHDVLADLFESHRDRLRAVAYRMLGSTGEADDAVQETWVRLSRSDTSAVENMGGWLTTVVARVCLNMLRSRQGRREEPIADTVVRGGDGASAWAEDPADAALMADSVGLALLVVLDTLEPAERLAFVLHDMFAVPFDEIAPIVQRTPAAARQLASRARRRVQGAAAPAADATRQRQVVTAFLAASRNGDFEALVALLDPAVELRADRAATAMGASPAAGARDVAATFSGRARAAQPALIDGMAGLVWSAGGRPKMVFAFTVAAGRIVAIDMIADQLRLDGFEVTPLDA